MLIEPSTARALVSDGKICYEYVKNEERKKGKKSLEVAIPLADVR